ncbi:MAG: hypothetical protein ACJARZ_001319 [Dokdonia sp.]|jgi:hypothetical protein
MYPTMKSSGIKRRNFLKTASLAAAGTLSLVSVPYLEQHLYL